MDANQQPGPAGLWRLIFGFRLSQAIHVAAKLGLADLLKNGPMSMEALARATGTHAPSLYRLMRLLASEGVFAETDLGRFEMTMLAVLLQSDVPGSLRARAIFDGEACNWLAWGQLLHGVRTGRPAFDHANGAGFFRYLEEHPAAGSIFNDLMVEMTTPAALAVVEAYDFSGIRSLVDVGGGYGALLTAIMAAYPSLYGILYDQPHVVEGARQRFAAAGMAERCQVLAGDFFEAVPEGGEVYLLKFILHDWDDDRCRTILDNCRRAMPAAGRLLVVEVLIPPGNEPGFGKYLDLNMLVLLTGRERSEAEYRSLLAATGFELARVVSTRSEISILEAKPV